MGYLLTIDLLNMDAVVDDNRSCFDMVFLWGGRQVSSVCAETLRSFGITDVWVGRSFAAIKTNVCI